jgi:uncharacterized membrane protein YdjX (TVP38/TMEM64 family)
MKTNLFFILIVLTVTPITLWGSREPLFRLWMWFNDREAVSASMEHLGIWGVTFLSFLFILQVFLAFIPGQALMVASGFLYGFWGGLLLSWISLVAGGELAFVLARRYGRTFAEKWISPTALARWDRTAQGAGIGFFTISLVMPLMPNDAMCYVAGLGKISHRRFSIANLLGRGIACIFTSAAGAFGLNIPWQVWVVVIFILIGGSLAWLIDRNRTSCFLQGEEHKSIRKKENQT